MIPQTRLKALLEYRDGGLYRLHNVSRVLKGSRFGSIESKGYRQGRLEGKFYLEHRLIWLYFKGRMPINQIDHINGDRLDNRIENLREVTRECNLLNQKIRKTNTSGVTGVSYSYRDDTYLVKLSAKHIACHKDLLEAALIRYTCGIWHDPNMCNAQAHIISQIRKIWPEFLITHTNGSV